MHCNSRKPQPIFSVYSLKLPQSGFTLIELVIGMLVLSIAIVMLTSMLLPQADRAVETLSRVRSAELAHSVMNEIWGKRYDENTNSNGGIPACNSTAPSNIGKSCTETDDLGDDDENRNDFNDVDDYHGLSINSYMLDSNQTYAEVYLGYQMLVTVEYLNGQAQKLITIDVTTPSNEVITYQAVRSNY
ncbi:type II secretion system GspH family protein [Shewanella olleyana]|uniref:type IV pilus modification PilV family protein n=1 Tax=Shewanella olleyana TaxID=135626 RepID=UPI00200CE90E|nr:type II secretion system protein [Shewanella olleyana]MCL1068463.1 type II secretion system GspH family protein [Shewanella olleyana]